MSWDKSEGETAVASVDASGLLQSDATLVFPGFSDDVAAIFGNADPLMPVGVRPKAGKRITITDPATVKFYRDLSKAIDIDVKVVLGLVAPVAMRLFERVAEIVPDREPWMESEEWLKIIQTAVMICVREIDTNESSTD